MNIFILAFQEILYRPLLNLLVVFYQYIPPFDFGIAILILTILLRLILWPLNSKAIVGQRETQVKTQELQEKMKEVQEKYKIDKAKQSEEIMKVWKEKKFNPFASFAPMIVQIIILIALYQVLRTVIQPEGLTLLYSFVPHPGEIDSTFLGVLDLSKASPILAVLTGVSQYFYSKMTFSLQPKIQRKKKKKDSGGKRDAQQEKMEEMQQKMQKIMQNQMVYFMPIFMVFICWSLPSALPLYWLVSTIIGIFQQKRIYKNLALRQEP
jgi:YidC/Oxa1 family membrane protein insertase